MSAVIDLIHIGYPKSASTLLQQVVFAAHTDIHLVEPKALTRRIVFHDDNDLDIEAVRGLARDGLDETKINLYSDEGLSGWGFHFNYARVARRLHAIFPDAKIIIIIRNQIGFLESLYRHKLHFGYGFTPDRFVNTYCRNHNVFHGIAYSRVIAEYRNLFDDVVVEPMERLTSPAHAAACLTRLCSFAGVDSEALDPAMLTPVNVGMSPLSVSLTRVLNRVSATKVQGFDNARIYNFWRYRWSRRIDAISRLAGLKDKFEFPQHLRASITEHFKAAIAQSNGTKLMPSRVFYPETGGMRGFCESATRKLTELGVEIKCGVGIDTIGFEDDGVTLGIEGGETIRADSLLWTAGSVALAKLLGVSQRLAEHIHNVPMVLYYFAIDQSQVGEFCYIQDFDPKDIIYRGSAPGSYGAGTCPPGKAYACAEILTRFGAPEWNQPERFTEQAWNELKRHRVVTGGEPADVLIHKAPVSYNFPKVGFESEIAPLRERLKTIPRLHLASHVTQSRTAIIAGVADLIEHEA